MAIVKDRSYSFIRSKAKIDVHSLMISFLDERLLFVITLALDLGFLAVYFWRWRRGGARGLRVLFAHLAWWKSALWGLLAGGGVIGIGELVTWLQQQAGAPAPDQAVLRALTGGAWWLMGLGILALGVLALVAEEIFFRGYVFDTLLRQNKVGAYLISAALFALVHLEPAVMLPIFTIGLVLAYSYHRTGNLTVSVMAHAMNNLLAVALVYMGNGG